jgi:YidC/Oxa1 family membrane protein insertase
MGLVARETPRPAGDEAADVNALEKVKFYARVAKRWNQEKGERGMAGPVWLFTPVFAHLPSFVTMMWTVKYMAASGEYGFETGGLFWFKDLTLPAVDLVSMTAPMGALGAILPATLIATYIFNMQQLFGNKQGPGTTTDLFLRSFLEMLTIPMLIIGLQLPHGIFCYWLTSSTFNMIQNPLLNHEYTQKLLGNRQRLPIKREAAETEQRLTIEQEETAGAAVERGATTASSTLPLSEKLFEKARELSSSGRESDQFMLGEKGIQALSYEQVTSIAKTLAKKGDWKQAHQLFLVAATKCEDLDSANHIQSLFWAGIASAKLGYKENAIELFTNVIKRDSKNTQSMLALANIHQKDENVEGARQWIERAAALDSKIKEAFLDPFNRDNPPSG